MSTNHYDLDHVALAAMDTAPLLRFLTGTCGATVLWGGQAIGFRPMQVYAGDAIAGMRIELLEPWAVEHNDFLARFVARHTHGPHHLTFKVPDIDAAIERVRASGFRPVNVDLSDPNWKEAFLLPKEAHGTVVQLAESNESHQTRDRAAMLETARRDGAHGHPRWWVDPEPPHGPALQLRHVVVRTPSLSSALAFFAGMLGGDVSEEQAGRVHLTWPGGAALSLEERRDVGPAIDRLEFAGLDREYEVLGTRFTPA
jgi:catechol 2,3-dioxygenase-like lactoylglutathione lyase family enzyme